MIMLPVLLAIYTAYLVVMAHLGKAMAYHYVALRVGGAEHALACERMYLWRDWAMFANGAYGSFWFFWPKIDLGSYIAIAVALAMIFFLHRRVHCDYHQGLWQRVKNMARGLTRIPKVVMAR